MIHEQFTKREQYIDLLQQKIQEKRDMELAMYHSKFTGTPSEFNVSMSEMNIQIIRLSSNFRYFTMRTEKISEFEAAQIVQTHIDDIKSEIYGPKRGQSPAD